LIVSDAQAADNPQLSALTLAISTHGLTLSADDAGNITGTDVNHQTVVTAPTPIMWDSAASPSVTTSSTAGRPKLAARTGEPVASSADGPGQDAHTAALDVAVGTGKITLTPSKALLAKATWPVYIDPGFSWGTAENGYAVIDDSKSQTKYWNSSP